MRRYTSITFLCMGLGAPLAAQSTEDFPRAEIFADAIVEFVKSECGSNALSDNGIKSEIRYILEAPLAVSSGTGPVVPTYSDYLIYHLEAIGKNFVALQMSAKDKYSVAMVVLGAYGLMQILDFQSAVADDDALMKSDYLLNEGTLQRRAHASLELLDCLWQDPNEISISSEASAFGVRGDDMWRNSVNAVLRGNCKTEFLKLASEYVHTDFSRIAVEDRSDFVGGLFTEHQAYIDSQRQQSKCEDTL